MYIVQRRTDHIYSFILRAIFSPEGGGGLGASWTIPSAGFNIKTGFVVD